MTQVRTLVLIVLCSTLVASKNFAFTETRYSEAFDASTERTGHISFKKRSLKINYDNSNKEIIYKEPILSILQGTEVVELDAVQEQRISSFLDILLELYEYNRANIENKFDISKEKSNIILIPKQNTKNYIKKIILEKPNESLKKIGLYLDNNDIITIRIGNEVP